MKRYYTRKDLLLLFRSNAKEPLYFYLDILKPLSQRKKTLLVHTSYKELIKLSRVFSLTHQAIRRRLKHLEEKNIIKRIIKNTISNEGKIERNTLFIEFLNGKEGLNNA